jgi:hypothetical protein
VIRPARTPSEDNVRCPVIAGANMKEAGPDIFLLMDSGLDDEDLGLGYGDLSLDDRDMEY